MLLEAEQRIYTRQQSRQKSLHRWAKQSHMPRHICTAGVSCTLMVEEKQRSFSFIWLSNHHRMQQEMRERNCGLLLLLVWSPLEAETFYPRFQILNTQKLINYCGKSNHKDLVFRVAYWQHFISWIMTHRSPIYNLLLHIGIVSAKLGLYLLDIRSIPKFAVSHSCIKNPRPHVIILYHLVNHKVTPTLNQPHLTGPFGL